MFYNMRSWILALSLFTFPLSALMSDAWAQKLENVEVRSKGVTAQGFGCTSFNPLASEAPSYMQYVHNPWYTNHGSYLWPSSSVYLRRNAGYTNDFTFHFPNGHAWLLRNAGYTNDKTLYWPNGQVLMRRNYGYTNDGTLYRADGSVWVVRNHGYTNDGTVYGLRFAEYFREESNGSLIYMRVDLNADLSVTMDLGAVYDNYEIDIFKRPSWAFGYTEDQIEVSECSGLGYYGERLPRSPQRIDVFPASETSLNVQITPRSFNATNQYRYTYSDVSEPANCEGGSPVFGLQFTIFGLKAATKYWVRVCGAGGVDWLTAGVTGSGQTLIPIPPAQPIVAVQGTPSTTTVDLGISPGFGGSQTVAFVLSTSSANCSQAQNIGLVSHYTLTNLRPNEVRAVSVCAVDRYGTLSAPRTIEVATAKQQPTLQLTIFRGRPQVYWQWPWANAEFRIEVATDLKGLWTAASNSATYNATTGVYYWNDPDLVTTAPRRFYRVIFIRYTN